MIKRNLILASAVALALGSGSVMAVTANTAVAAKTYAMESFPGQNQLVIPTGTVKITSTVAGEFATGPLVITLDSGTFESAPVATVADAGPGLVLSSTVGTISSDKRSVSFLVSITNGGAASVTLSSFTIGGIGSKMAVDTATIGYTSTINGTSTGAAATIATSGASFGFTNPTAGAAKATTIDVAFGGGGTLFRVGSTNSKVANIASFDTGALSATNVLIDGSTKINAVTLGDTATASLTGDFSAMSSVYLIDSASGSCTETVPAAALVGTISGTGVTFTSLQPSKTYLACAVANGTSVITAGGIGALLNIPTKVTYNYIARTAGTTTYIPAPTVASAASGTNTFGYNGSVANVNYVVGNGGGYAMYLNVVNPSGAAVPVFVTVRQANGTIKSGTLTSALAANSSVLFTVPQIATASGAALSSETDRAAITVFSPAAIRVTNFMLNPGAAVTQIGQTFQ